MQHEEKLLHIIGVGSTDDWEEGRGSVYYVEDKNGEKALPVFTTVEGAGGYIEANFAAPDAHMDMLESVPVSHTQPLTEGRYIVMPLTFTAVAEQAVRMGADYLVRDPRPGAEQEILHVPK